jgi:pheromone shutdown-related protein TraB
MDKATVKYNEDNVTRLNFNQREIILVGTAHISKESVEEVQRIIDSEKPDHVCVEIDKSRYISLIRKRDFSNLKINQILRQGKGFLLLSTLVLASFQRRLGMELGIKPGEDMLAAIKASEKAGIPYSFCDRDVQITLKRAWAKSGFFGKNKMLAALITSAFFNEKLDEKELAELKKKSVLENMMEELSSFLPRVKEVLLDERDIYLATKVFQASGKKIVAVVGAGHVQGMARQLKALEEGKAQPDLSELEVIPKKGSIKRILAWAIPIAIIAAFIGVFLLHGVDLTLHNLIRWVLFNGTLSALGALFCLAHPLTILVSFIAAPITSLIPVIGVGIPAGLLEASLRKPQVRDFESLHDDLAGFKNMYKNKFVHILFVFAFTSLGSVIGTLLSGGALFSDLINTIVKFIR